MSLLRLTGWTLQIGKSACGGYRHDPPVRSAASEMVWTRFQLFYPEGPRCTRRSFTEQLIGCPAGEPQCRRTGNYWHRTNN